MRELVVFIIYANPSREIPSTRLVGLSTRCCLNKSSLFIAKGVTFPEDIRCAGEPPHSHLIHPHVA